ncbi:MAG: DUF1674 domain-containing protein [Alphaproteobacteria bacterium]|nr:DUF1674 domain-containing protein [Alphaproteobacteria bacterium SS10]MBV6634254.1 DUF1674 domain-containing protein [Alphaproteobacteria bacterium SS10]
MTDDTKSAANDQVSEEATTDDAAAKKSRKLKEIGGPPGPEPTRYGDWENKGRCTDF